MGIPCCDDNCGAARESLRVALQEGGWYSGNRPDGLHLPEEELPPVALTGKQLPLVILIRRQHVRLVLHLQHGGLALLCTVVQQRDAKKLLKS